MIVVDLSATSEMNHIHDCKNSAVKAVSLLRYLEMGSQLCYTLPSLPPLIALPHHGLQASISSLEHLILDTMLLRAPSRLFASSVKLNNDQLDAGYKG